MGEASSGEDTRGDSRLRLCTARREVEGPLLPPYERRVAKKIVLRTELDPLHFGTRTGTDPDPALFVGDAQDANKNFCLLLFDGTFTLFFKDKN